MILDNQQRNFHPAKCFVPYRCERDQLGRIIRSRPKREPLPEIQPPTKVIPTQSDANQAAFSNPIIKKFISTKQKPQSHITRIQCSSYRDLLQPHVNFKLDNWNSSKRKPQSQSRSPGDKPSLTDRKVKQIVPPLGYYQVDSSITLKRQQSTIILASHRSRIFSQRSQQKSTSLRRDMSQQKCVEDTNSVSRQCWVEVRSQLHEDEIRQQMDQLQLKEQEIDMNFFHRFAGLIKQQKRQILQNQVDTKDWYDRRVQYLKNL